MSAETEAKLRQMRDAVPDESDALANSITQVNEQIAELTEQALALETEITTPDEATAVIIIETIILPTFPVGSYVVYGAGFGAISWSPKGNLSAWSIWINILPIPPPILPPVPTLIYTYVNNGTYPDIDALVDDYAFTNDYLTKPLYNSGSPDASYGIYPTIVNLNLGKTYLTNNKTKIDASESVLSGYID
jgi:hypothetical protein